MKKYYAREALLPRGWARDVTIAVHKGDIVEVKAGARDRDRDAGPVPRGE